MSTRGAIARLENFQPLCFCGRYVHWDCYPTGLGASLWQAYQGHFEKDLDRMLGYLLDEHPAGWSSLCGVDFLEAPGFREFNSAGRTSSVSESAPNCYCHGDRHEAAQEINERNASGCGCEWVYVFTHSLPETTAPSGNKGVPGQKNGCLNGSLNVLAHVKPVKSFRNGHAGVNGVKAIAQASGNGIADTILVPPPRHNPPLHQPAMIVLSSFTPHGDKMIGMFGCGDPNAHWRIVGMFDLHGPEPDWQCVEEEGHVHGHAKPGEPVLTNTQTTWAVSLN